MRSLVTAVVLLSVLILPGVTNSANALATPPVGDGPTNLVATAGYQRADLSFTPPAVSAAILGYEYTTDSALTWNPLAMIVVPFDGSATAPFARVSGLTNGVPTTIAVRAVTAAGPTSASSPVTVTSRGAVFTPSLPMRAYDSRDGDGPLTAGASRTLTLAELVPVPPRTVAVSYTITVAGMNGSGYVTVSPKASDVGGTSTINYTAAGQQWVNSATVGVGENAQIALTAAGAATEVIIDINGYWTEEPPPEELQPTTSTYTQTEGLRVYDSRNTDGPMRAGERRRINVSATGIVPVWATAVTYTLTQTGTIGRGYLTAAPAGSPLPPTSVVNWFGSNQTTANTSTVAINGGEIDVWAMSSTAGSANFLIDIVGYYGPSNINPEGGRYTPISPQRAYDSRLDAPTGPIRDGETFTNSVVVGGVPATAEAVTVNVTATGTVRTGYLLVVDSAVNLPPAVSTLNWFWPGQTTANATVAPVEPVGSTAVLAWGGDTNYLLDITGYFDTAPS